MDVSRSLGLLAIAATACIGFGCADDPNADEVSSEDRRVLYTLIEIACNLDFDRIVISDRPAVPLETIQPKSYRENLKFRLTLDRRIARKAHWSRRQICPAVRIVADSAIAAALAQEKETPPTWEHFSAAFGGARTLMRVSLPVYSSDGRHAVVYTTSTCPYTCGAGFYHELEKVYGKWEITGSVNAWRSGSSPGDTTATKP